jgi:uncharacterized protein DUF402
MVIKSSGASCSAGQTRTNADAARPAGLSAFAPGASIVRRDTVLGRVWGVAPLRVISDTPEALVAACWQGIRMLSPASYIEAWRTGLPAGRLQLIRELATGTWELGERTWQDNADLTWVGRGECFSVHRFFGPDEEPGVWYVNFELPARRTAIGYDTCDLCIDLIVGPDLRSYEWKDEEEYAYGARGRLHHRCGARADRTGERAGANPAGRACWTVCGQLVRLATRSVLAAARPARKRAHRASGS